ncbi:MAG: B3/B4 domain-containing protein [Candidatus Hodarchaeales archaeon]
MIEVKWQVPAEKREGLNLVLALIKSVKVSNEFGVLKDIEEEIFSKIHSSYNTENLKDDPKIRAYRDFFWKWKIADPTRVRPASEALIRRILINRNIWKVNTVVNAYNLASAITGISMGAYDIDLIQEPLVVRFAQPKEPFMGIGSQLKHMKGNELVLADQKGIISVYPYRDADRTKITLNTSKMLLVAFGVPGLDVSELEESIQNTVSILEDINAGKLEDISFY